MGFKGAGSGGTASEMAQTGLKPIWTRLQQNSTTNSKQTFLFIFPSENTSKKL